MEAVGNSLIEESNLNIDLEECVNERVDECNLTTSFLCGLCSKIYKSKGGLALHTRAKHGKKMDVTKSVSPLTSEVIVEIIDKVTLSIVKSKLYGMHR
jgi:hypothetical protein